MRFIIYGAGGIGSIIGGHLFRTRHDVILIARPGHVRAINENGLKLNTPSGTHLLRLPAVTHPEQIQFRSGDVVLLTMKSQHTEDALRTLKSCVSSVPVFCVQNGVRNEETAAALFPDVYGVTVRLGAVFVHDGEVTARTDPAGWLICGRYPEGTDALLEAVAGCCRQASLIARTTPHIMQFKWGKLVTNVATAVGAITNAGRADAQELGTLARKELIALLNEAAIPYLTDAQIAQQWPDFQREGPKFGAGEAQSSTWQSLARKQGSVETEYFNGEAPRLARRLGKTAPINEGLNRVMQEMAANREVPGKYTLAELKSILGLD